MKQRKYKVHYTKQITGHIIVKAGSDSEAENMAYYEIDDLAHSEDNKPAILITAVKPL